VMNGISSVVNYAGDLFRRFDDYGKTL
jgi:hypothetical protein